MLKHPMLKIIQASKKGKHTTERRGNARIPGGSAVHWAGLLLVPPLQAPMLQL